jgi:type IV pilus assembly protein PilC
MELFEYRAVDDRGNGINGELNAIDYFDARRRLLEKGLILVNLKKASSFKKSIDKLSVPRVSKKFLAFFCRELALILRSGVGLVKGLDIILEQTKESNSARFFEEIYKEVQKGRLLSEAFQIQRSEVPSLLISMIAIGEESGTLDEVLIRMAIYYDKETYMKSKIIGAMIYPIIMLIVSIGLIAFFMAFVMPEIMTVYMDSDIELPLITIIVIGIIDIIKAYYIYFLAIVGGLLLGGKIFIPNKKKRELYSNITRRIPVIKYVIKDLITTRLLQNLGLLLKSGVDLIAALENIQNIMGDILVERMINNTVQSVKKGSRFADTLSRQGYFDPLVSNMIKIGEETGELDQVLESLSYEYEKKSELGLMKITTASEPIMIILMGISMGILIIAMVLPMFQMVDVIG